MLTGVKELFPDKERKEGMQMSYPAKKEGSRYTYKDYLSWPDDERWEIIEGHAYCMSPAPTWKHQLILGELHRQIATYLTGKECRAFLAPFDVRLSTVENDEDSMTVVQPDLSIVCDRTKLRKTGYAGVPEMIIEVISPSSAKRDRLLKFNEYEKAGVKEYWIVAPLEKIVMVFILNKDNQYGRPDVYSEDGMITTSIFNDLTVDLSKVFAEI